MSERLKRPPLPWLRWSAPVSARWHALSPRERRLLQALAVLLALALVWWGLIAPPLQRLHNSAAQRAALASAQAQMQVWQTQAQAAQQQPRLGASEAATVLRTLTAAAGPGWQLQIQGERASLQVQDATPDALAQWLVQAREQAQSLPIQAQLERADGAATQPARAVHWRGRLVLALPNPGQP